MLRHPAFSVSVKRPLERGERVRRHLGRRNDASAGRPAGRRGGRAGRRRGLDEIGEGRGPGEGLGLAGRGEGGAARRGTQVRRRDRNARESRGSPERSGAFMVFWGPTGKLDIGQGAISYNGQVIALEAIEGTDNMIERAALFRTAKSGGVLVKMKKPRQNPKVDLPAIGIDTVINSYKAGLEGIAVEAGASILIDKEELIREANRLGLFICGV